jgi:hypothetical protein
MREIAPALRWRIVVVTIVIASITCDTEGMLQTVRREKRHRSGEDSRAVNGELSCLGTEEAMYPLSHDFAINFVSNTLETMNLMLPGGV